MKSTDEILWRLSRLLFWCGCVVVAILALMPKERMPIILDFWDKAQHFTSFFVLGVLGSLVYCGLRPRVLVCLCIFGAVIELLQWAVGFRVGSWADWLADVAGLTMAYGFTWRLMSYPRIRRVYDAKSFS